MALGFSSGPVSLGRGGVAPHAALYAIALAVAAGCGGKSENGELEIALGEWPGMTSQGKEVGFTITKAGVSEVLVGYTALCVDAISHFDSSTHPIVGNRLRFEAAIGSMQFDFDGIFDSAESASGTLRLSAPTQDGPICAGEETLDWLVHWASDSGAGNAGR